MNSHNCFVFEVVFLCFYWLLVDCNAVIITCTFIKIKVIYLLVSTTYLIQDNKIS